MEYLVVAVLFGCLLIIAGIFDIKSLLSVFSYHNFFLELFGYKGLKIICMTTGVILIVGAIYAYVT